MRESSRSSSFGSYADKGTHEPIGALYVTLHSGNSLKSKGSCGNPRVKFWVDQQDSPRSAAASPEASKGVKSARKSVTKLIQSVSGLSSEVGVQYSSVQETTLNPIWEESFRLEVYSYSASLRCEVYDHDRFSEDFLGACEVELSTCLGHYGELLEKQTYLLAGKLKGHGGSHDPKALAGTLCMTLVFESRERPQVLLSMEEAWTLPVQGSVRCDVCFGSNPVEKTHYANVTEGRASWGANFTFDIVELERTTLDVQVIHKTEHMVHSKKSLLGNVWLNIELLFQEALKWPGAPHCAWYPILKGIGGDSAGSDVTNGELYLRVEFIQLEQLQQGLTEGSSQHRRRVFIQTAKDDIKARSGKARRRSTSKSPAAQTLDKKHHSEAEPDYIITPASPGSTSRTMLEPETPSSVSDTARQLHFRQEVEEHVAAVWRHFTQRARKQNRHDGVPQIQASTDVSTPIADTGEAESESSAELPGENAIDRAPGGDTVDHANLASGTGTESFSEHSEERPHPGSSDGDVEAGSVRSGRTAAAAPKSRTSELTADGRSTFWHAESNLTPEEDQRLRLRETPGVSLVPTRMRASTMQADTTEDRGIALLAAMPTQDTEAILNLTQQTTVPNLQRQIRASQIDAQVASIVESLWGMLPLEIANQLSSRRLLGKPEECAAILAQLARRAGLMQDVSHGFQTGEQLVANVLKNVPPATGAKILMLLPGEVGAGTMICLPAAVRDALLEALPAEDLIQMVASEEGDIAVQSETGDQAGSVDQQRSTAGSIDQQSAEQTIQSPGSPSAIPSTTCSEPAVAELPPEIVSGIRLLAQLLGVRAASALDQAREASTSTEGSSSSSLPSSAPPSYDSTREDECDTAKAVMQLLQEVVGHVAQMDLKQNGAVLQAPAKVVEMREENAKLNVLLDEAKREVDICKRARAEVLKRHREATELGIKNASEAGMAKGEALMATQAHKEEVSRHAVTSAALKAVTEAYRSEQKNHEAVIEELAATRQELAALQSCHEISSAELDKSKRDLEACKAMAEEEHTRLRAMLAQAKEWSLQSQEEVKVQQRANRILKMESQIAVQQLRMKGSPVEMPELPNIEEVFTWYCTNAERESSKLTLKDKTSAKILAEDPDFVLACETWKGICSTILSCRGKSRAASPRSPRPSSSIASFDSPHRTPTFITSACTPNTPATLEHMIDSLKECLEFKGISLRVKRLGNFKYYLGSKVYTLKVSNGAIVARMGGGYSSIVDVLGSLSPAVISENPTCKEANVQKHLIHRDQPSEEPLLTLPSPSA